MTTRFPTTFHTAGTTYSRAGLYKLPAQPVAIAGAAGFPLSDVVDAITASALASNEALTAEIATLKADKDAADKARDDALAQVAGLQAQIDALKPAEVKGVPQTITPAQGETQLLREGLLDAVTAALASPDTPAEMKIAFARATQWERTSPSVIAMMGMLGKTDADADAFFTAAAQIKL